MISAALFARERTGEGDLVSTSLLPPGCLHHRLRCECRPDVGTADTGRDAYGDGQRRHQQLSAGDGRRFWIVGLEGHRHWPPAGPRRRPPRMARGRAVRHAGRPGPNATELIALLDESFATKTLDEWAAVFDADPDFFWAPVQTVDELLGDQQFHAAGGLVDVPTRTVRGRCWRPRRTSTSTAAPRYRAPHLGEHTHEVLAELGKSEEEISALAASGVTPRTATDRHHDLGPGPPLLTQLDPRSSVKARSGYGPGGPK